MSHKAVSSIMSTKNEWMGEVKPIDIGLYIDLMLVLIFGGIPWQVYFQRVLSAKTEKSAMYLSYIAAIGCFVAGIPPVIIGAIAKSTSNEAYVLDSSELFGLNKQKNHEIDFNLLIGRKSF